VSALTYRAFEPRDLEPSLALFKAAFGGRSLAPGEYEHFFLHANPFGPPMIELAFDGDLLVGHYALCPAESRVDGALVRTARSMTTMTHPDYAGRGIFSSLAERLYGRVERDHGVGFIWGFPNANSHFGFTQKLRWHDLFALFFLDVPAQASATAPRVVPLEPADAHARLASVGAPRSGVQPFARTSRFLDWRYAGKPRYRLVGLEGSDAFAVVSTFEGAEARALNLVDAFFGSARDASALVEGLACHAAEQGCATLSIWCDLRSPVWSAGEKARGRPRGVMTYAGVRRAALADTALDDPRRWCVTMGDSDVF
jgi:hypothetical protein